jgi:hypothetical protein
MKSLDNRSSASDHAPINLRGEPKVEKSTQAADMHVLFAMFQDEAVFHFLGL